MVTETAKVRTRDFAEKVDDCVKRTKEATRECYLSLSFIFFFLRYYLPSFSPLSFRPLVAFFHRGDLRLRNKQAAEKEDAQTTKEASVRGWMWPRVLGWYVLRVSEEGWKTGGADPQTVLQRGWRMADSSPKEEKGKRGKPEREKEMENGKEIRKRDAR